MSTGSAYTDEQLSWLRDNYAVKPYSILVVEFNQRYGQNRTADAIKGILFRKGIRSGRTGCFEKGLIPWNQGKKGYMGANVTSFKKGNMPWTKKPLYTERISKDGYIEISVPERNPFTGAESRFKGKHLWLWEQEHGPLPKGHVVIFSDGDNRNFASDNLLLVTREELLQLNWNRYHHQPAEVKPTILAMVKLNVAAGIRGKRVHSVWKNRKEKQ